MPTAAPSAPLATDAAKLTARANPEYVTCDANEAVASVAHRLSEFIAIYPITPSSPMAESCDEWSAAGKTNIWGEIPKVVQLQSEAGVAGAVHGGLLGGALTTTFTASQGLLLMVPNLYKIAGELLPFALHVTARAIAAQGLSIFGDHQDVMACRQTGCALLCSNNPQEAQDLALVAHAATLKGRVPIIHFFDGFRTSHEIAKIRPLSNEVLRAMIDEKALADFRLRALSPDRPKIHGTAQNPDVYFQGRETVNPFVDAFPGVVQDCMDKLAELTGRRYSLAEYHGHPQAERVVVCMGSGVEALHAAADHLNANGQRVGVISIRLFQPFPVKAFLDVLPPTVRTLGVLDRTKEPGAVGEPLFMSVLSALSRAEHPTSVPPSRVFGGRYGLGSKEFTPAMSEAVFNHLNSARPKHGFTIGIHDDVTHTSLPWNNDLELEAPGVRRCVFIGLGADGTVGANKNSIKIIGEQTDFFAQGYFVYDSKKSGSVTVSHLRFGPQPIRAPWLIRHAQFVACSQWSFVGRHEILGYAAPGATLLLDSPHSPEETWNRFPRDWKQTIVSKKLRVFVIDANGVAASTGMGRRTNTILQTCFFALSGVLPQDEAITHIKKAITKTYSRKGERVVQMNHAAVDAALAALHEVTVPAKLEECDAAPAPDRFAAFTPGFFRDVTARLLAGEGDLLPVSALPPDGGWPTATTRLEKRSIALELPQWDASLCIQCNKCVFVCPHAAIRATHLAPADLAGAPETLATLPFRSNELPGRRYLIQVAPDDCTGCSLCVQVCPAKDKSNPKHKALDLVPAAPRMEIERRNWEFFEKLPAPDRATVDLTTVKGSQFAKPLFEFSGACAGCGETPYIKLLTQVLGDRLIIANATGCSSIYGGNLPTTPYCKDSAGRGPAWANSLFEDNAEFGLGLRHAADRRHLSARALLGKLAAKLDPDLVRELESAAPTNESELADRRALVAQLKVALEDLAPTCPDAARLLLVADDLVKKSVWIIGGDGWAYDIGYGGLDHVLASGANVKILVLDTEVYSNTGGQSSKSTPLGAVAKFAAGGKPTGKKDLALLALHYGHVYVARVAFGAKDSQTLQAIREAEAFDGPALIIAYSHCIAHGYNLARGLDQQKLAVDTGYWPLFRHDPRRVERGEPALALDSPAPKIELSKFTANETRFGMLAAMAPRKAEEFAAAGQAALKTRYELYKHLATPSTSANPPAATI
jgi:pyruvate:ferredoxin (flavodoxin) oxidoreductase, homodimeric